MKRWKRLWYRLKGWKIDRILCIDTLNGTNLNVRFKTLNIHLLGIKSLKIPFIFFYTDHGDLSFKVNNIREVTVYERVKTKTSEKKIPTSIIPYIGIDEFVKRQSEDQWEWFKKYLKISEGKICTIIAT